MLRVSFFSFLKQFEIIDYSFKLGPQVSTLSKQTFVENLRLTYRRIMVPRGIIDGLSFVFSNYDYSLAKQKQVG